MSQIVDEDGWILFSARPELGESTWVKYELDCMRIRYSSVMDPYLDANAEARMQSHGQRWGDGKLVSSVPLKYALKTGYADAIREGDDKWKQRFLNDRDNYKLRTFEGKL